jgi:hypothetical protein
VWLNNGGGQLVPVAVPAAMSDTQAIAIGDLNGNGDPDIVVVNGGNQPDQIWFNNGSGTFSVYPIPSIINADSQGVAQGDLDNDGDLDTFVSNGDDNDGTNPDSPATTNQVLFNLNNQPAIVGPNGGTLRFSQGMTLTVDIPAGLLAQNTIFNFAPLTPTLHPAPADFTFAGRGFSLKGASFNNTPVTATVYFNPLAFEGTRPMLHYWETEDGPNKDSWVDVAESCTPKSGYSYGSNWLQVAFCHLTDFGIFGGSGSDVYLPTVIKN